MRMRKKKWVKPYLEQEGKYLLKGTKKGNYRKEYPDRKIILEIGMGMGDFITEKAKEDRGNLYIGYEKDETCVAKAIQKAEELGLENLIIVHDNADVLTEQFASEEVDMIYLQFSDPWPKKGHHKRRLTYHTFLAIYDAILKKGGTIFFKTDNKDLYEFSIPSFLNYGFKMVEMSVDYHRNGLIEPMTGYERKFTSLGQPIYYALFQKGEEA